MMTIDLPPLRKIERLHSLDALRGFALLSGVALHATMAFLPNVQLWIIRDRPSLALALLFYTVHMFRMPVFFLLAGYFARLLLERRGTAGFVRDRAVRIAAPFLVFHPIVGAATIACAIWAMRTTGQTLIPGGGAGAARPQLSLNTVPLTHLWFLYVLLLFYIGALLVRALASLIDRDRRWSGSAIDRATRSLTATPLVSLALAIPLACAFALTPAWRAWLGILPPAFGFVPNGSALVGYGTAFAFGWLLCRQSVLLQLLARWWSVQIALALAATAYCVVEIGVHPSLEFTPPSARLTLYACCYALGVWAWTLGLTGAAIRLLAAERPVIRYLSDSSYWIFIVHIPVLAALQVLVFPLALPAPAKYALVLTGLAVLLPLSYELLIRHSFMGRWLNGRSYPWRGSGRSDYQTWQTGGAKPAPAHAADRPEA
jgi:glucan biosynthesis protein C